MQRRSFLAAVGGGAVSSLAGCAARHSIPQSRFDSDASCPEEVDRCYHETGDEAVYLAPKRERVEMGGSATFHLVNRRPSSLSIGPDYWRLWRETDSGWTKVPRKSVVDPGMSISPFGTHPWNVPITPDDTPPNRDATPDWVAESIAFEPGRYCFTAFDVQAEAGKDETFGALFDVVEKR
ncbi:hypothetical protein C453_16573 [Haloferax elongans ATCC BAA-1513]|uniref:Lipoprotein n=1 Tax=Haloferax elongans ATCC BAA-1513 TaxID=1230453 RepID=M0HFZ5_HALEO|nr:hypothetical protein [Haloferax elongans]ELZ82718.1 hypothetical protein C453_16573 [Haloferax elongans ATCC BAA-1513]